MWRQLDTVVSFGPLARIIVCSLVLAVLLFAVVQAVLPQIILPPAWKCLLILPGVILYCIFYLTLLTIVPKRIIIRLDRIIVDHAHTCKFDTKRIRKVWLTVHRGNRTRLKVRFERLNGKGRTWTIGVASAVDLEKLCSMMPVPVIVRDARNRHIKPQPGAQLSRARV